MSCSKILAAVGAAIVFCCPAAHAGPRDFVIHVTRMGGDTEAAAPYVDKFLAYVESEGGWPKGSSKGKFLDSRKETLAYIESAKPGYGFLEPPMYFELRKSHALEPIVQVESKDLWSAHLHVVVKVPAALTDLRGKSLWTTLGDSPQYLSKVVLPGKIDARTFFSLKTIGQAMKGVRAVLRGEADATLVDDEQFEAAKKMDGGAALRSVYDSPPLPPLTVVAFGKNSRPEERKALTKVLLDMCGTPKGGEVCKEMHISRFAPLKASVVLDAQKRYEAP